MGNKILLIAIFSILHSYLGAQSPLFAVVRPDGTTYICPTWDSAYNRATDGDNIYLPGGTISFANLAVSKRLYIYGSGHHPDSTIATGITTIAGNFSVLKGADQGSVEGLNITSHIYFGSGLSNNNRANIQGYTIKRCRVSNIVLNNSTNPNTAFPDSLPSNLAIYESVFSQLYATYGNSHNISLSKNIITSVVQSVRFTSFNNNIFLAGPGTPIPVINCSFVNNIFCSGSTFNQCSSSFYNNLKVGSSNFLTGCAPGDGSQSGNISVASVSDIFIFYNGSGFLYSDNYHLKPTCPGINGGTDGTDVGIYGTISPVAEGWVPSNPHIYFKQVAPSTNSTGQLPVQFKVRTNN
ncbi:MAG: hypothetical protein JNM88_19165 [Chitinophagaceae bacterium]|nr:hypothetical protein [Chitinophagaceae bacterium]